MSNALTALTSKLAARLDMGADGSSLIDTLKATAFKGQVSDAQMTARLARQQAEAEGFAGYAITKIKEISS